MGPLSFVLDVRDFHAFSAMHGIVMAVFAMVTAIACAVGVRWRGTDRLRSLERGAGVLFLLIWLTTQIFWALPPRFSIGEALPLHMCDITGVIAPLVLLTPRRSLRTLLYFWGLGLSIQGILTPILKEGPGRIEFWLFWLSHLAIIGTGVYDVIARRYRPSLRDMLFATAACAVWLATVLAVDLNLGVNYGYVGNIRPEKPTVIDGLGPWPLRVYKMAVAVLVLFFAMWLPWGIVRRQRRVNQFQKNGV